MQPTMRSGTPSNDLSDHSLNTSSSLSFWVSIIELVGGEVPGIYGLNENGWIDQELYDCWLCHIFFRYSSPT